MGGGTSQGGEYGNEETLTVTAPPGKGKGADLDTEPTKHWSRWGFFAGAGVRNLTGTFGERGEATKSPE